MGLPDDEAVVAFVPGLELSRMLYQDVVGPLLERRFPGLAHGAALLGRGSEVLGYDDEMSTDHDWSARVQVFLDPGDLQALGDSVRDALGREVPATFAGRAASVEVTTVPELLDQQLGLDLGAADAEIDAYDWLSLPEHALGAVTAGAVHHDEVGLEATRARLAYYPRDVWLYLMVAGWWRVSPEANLAGRAGAAGDELGSSVLASRLVSDLMRLAFLLERRYAPYAKWFGTAFARLACGPTLGPLLLAVQRASGWQERESRLNAVYEQLATMHDGLGVTPPATTRVERMWDRPFQVVWADFPGLLRDAIEDPVVGAIADRWAFGPHDRFRELVGAPRDRRTLADVLRRQDAS